MKGLSKQISFILTEHLKTCLLVPDIEYSSHQLVIDVVDHEFPG